MAYVHSVAQDIAQREAQRWNIGCSGEDPLSCGEERERLGSKGGQRREREREKDGGRGKREGEEEREGRRKGGGRGGGEHVVCNKKYPKLTGCLAQCHVKSQDVM